MLGLADRGRILDLFEKLMGGKIADALTDLSQLYDVGADPLAVMQDLLETTHFLTRLRVAPGAEGFFDGGSAEAKRAAEMATKLSVPSLTRAWQLLLKGLFEVRDATRPIQAAEMALIRLAYAADLPPTDKLVRDVLDSNHPPLEGGGSGSVPTSKSAQQISGRGPTAQSHPSPKMTSSFSTLPQGEGGQTAAQRAPQPTAEIVNAPVLRSLEDIVALAEPTSKLRVDLRNNVHLISLEPGKIEFRPGAKAPSTLAGDLSQFLKLKTGTRWVVTVSREGGAPTLAETARSVQNAKLEAVAQEPMVRAVLDRFPGAEIVAVRDIADDTLPPAPETSEDA
jgi:DNA polymerase-3 subunit gamma/tau